ncbi:MAG: prepilin-type N-terminal cleavage/methylation domain-containing protein [Campylobacteraceae bacterium]|jgi:prepilin-type N-terminal cleavage/methylation domain-containing protein|nr:prepilin-type N-terminal cleavage/methylation domain-containing protein [Campylobacteraceae bacterium]
MMRKAFSLIELVISIVVVGIVSVSFPLILSQTSTNIAFAIQQEAILETKTYMGTILSYQWDSNSMFTDAEGTRIIVLNVPSGNENLKGDVVGGTLALRPGHILGDSRRKMGVNNVTNATVAPCASPSLCDEPSIDNFNNANAVQNLIVADGTKNIDSIMRLTLTPNIEYVSDTPDGGNYNDDSISFKFNRAAVVGTTNIKKITITTTSADDDEMEIVLRAYSSNIGEFQMDHRDGAY